MYRPPLHKLHDILDLVLLKVFGKVSFLEARKIFHNFQTEDTLSINAEFNFFIWLQRKDTKVNDGHPFARVL